MPKKISIFLSYIYCLTRKKNYCIFSIYCYFSLIFFRVTHTIKISSFFKTKKENINTTGQLKKSKGDTYMKKFIIHTLLFTIINHKLQLLGLSDNEIDFIDQLLDYAFDYLYDIFEHYLYPKIIKHLKKWTTMVKEYIIDIKSRLW